VSCAATPFSDLQPPDEHTASFTRSWYHAAGIWAGLAPPYDGHWYAGEPALKVLWFTELSGELRIEGRSLDDAGGALSAEVAPGYEGFGYQPSSILVPAPGCWEISGSVGEQQLRIVADVLPAEQHPLRAP
jgi:hypothetical protein